MATPTLALIGLGSNLGERRALLGDAITALDETPGVYVRAVSTFHETRPVGGPGGQGAFLNAAALLATTLEAEPLLDILLSVEERARRVRTMRWGPRTLDLDLLLFGASLVRTPRLTIPHPRMALRRFVLAPACEIAPSARDPMTNRTIAELLANLDRRPSCLALHGEAGPVQESIFRRVVSALEAAASENPKADDPVDRWLVTDFGLPRHRPAASRADAVRASEAPGREPSDPNRASDELQTFRAYSDRLFRPTFAVILKPGLDDESLAGVLDFPHLVVDPSDPDQAVVEVLAACAATRS